jgi:hypothetical protein
MQEIFYKIVMNSENSVATPPPSSSSSFATNSPYNHIISIKNTRRSDRLTRSEPPSHREIYYQQYLDGQVRCHRDGVPRGHLGRGRRPSRRGRGAANSQGHAMPARGAGKPARRVPAGTAAAADRPHGHRVRLVPVDHRAANAVLPAAPGREPRVPLRRHPPHGEGIRADHATSGRRGSGEGRLCSQQGSGYSAGCGGEMGWQRRQEGGGQGGQGCGCGCGQLIRGQQPATTRVRLGKARLLYAAQLPMMCSIEPQECNVFSGAGTDSY